jgi:hypothetical protein
MSYLDNNEILYDFYLLRGVESLKQRKLYGNFYFIIFLEANVKVKIILYSDEE